MWGDDEAGALSGGIREHLCAQEEWPSPLGAQGVMESSGMAPASATHRVQQLLFLIAGVGMVLFSS